MGYKVVFFDPLPISEMRIDTCLLHIQRRFVYSRVVRYHLLSLHLRSIAQESQRPSNGTSQREKTADQVHCPPFGD